MAGTTVSKLVVFTASLLVATSVALTLTGSVLDVRSSLSRTGVDAANDIATDVEIVSDAGSPGAIYDEPTTTVTLLVANSGTAPLAATNRSVDVLLDGRFATVTDLDVVSGSADGGWQPGEVVRLTVDGNLDVGEAHRATVHVSGGEATLAFYL